MHGGVEHGVAAGAVLVLLQLLQLPVTEDGAVLQDHAGAGRLTDQLNLVQVQGLSLNISEI